MKVGHLLVLYRSKIAMVALQVALISIDINQNKTNDRQMEQILVPWVAMIIHQELNSIL